MRNYFTPTLYRATIFNPLSPNEGQYFPDGALVVEVDGTITFCGRFIEAHQRFTDIEIIDCRPNIITPGFIDTHVHLPQFHISATSSGELLEWLTTVVFPAEEKFIEEEYAQRVANDFFRSALQHGTTSMACYSSSLYNATDIAFNAAKECGIRVWMGKTMMDCHSPSLLQQSTETNIRLSLALAHKWHGVDKGRLSYILTPRYAGSCTRELLQKTSEISVAENLMIQTHLSENIQELAFISQLFPHALDYTEVYDSVGLLSNNTILAHAIYLSEREISVIKHRNCGLSHCPTSNRFLQTGIMPTSSYLLQTEKIGLGTDIAGGYCLSILHEAKESVEQSKTLHVYSKNSYETVSVGEAFYLATLGGARVLNAETRIGNFGIGKEADFVIISRNSLLPRCKEDEEDPQDLLSRILYSPSNHTTIHSTFVRGKNVWKS